MLLQRQRAAPLLSAHAALPYASQAGIRWHSSLSQRIPEIPTAPESWKCVDRGYRGFKAPPIAQRHHYRSRGRSEGGFSSAHGSHNCSLKTDLGHAPAHNLHSPSTSGERQDTQNTPVQISHSDISRARQRHVHVSQPSSSGSLSLSLSLAPASGLVPRQRQ